ncbi:MAG TPA: aminotransferase class IV [Pirellulales bacterium]|nr:aminotransferase class IV [Pirellulales bacterium]
MFHQRPEAIAYLNGRFVPQSEVRIPVYDAGFMLGATVSEQLRTFAGKLFRLPEHLARLEESLAIVGTPLPIARDELAGIAEELVARNHALLPAGDDLGLSLFVTPGPYATLAGPDVAPGPTLGLHTYPLPFPLWREKYEGGERLMTPQIRQVPAECWPAQLKCRSRMHYYLADKEASRNYPGSRALLLDLAGHVLETSTANILVYDRARGLRIPPARTVLPGISLAATLGLADALGVAVSEAPLTVADVESADEVLLASTPYCLLPVTRINGHAIGTGRPGDTYARLLAGWNTLSGLDVAEQARAVVVERR